MTKTEILNTLAAADKEVAMREDFKNNTVKLEPSGFSSEAGFFRISAKELVKYIATSGRELI